MADLLPIIETLENRWMRAWIGRDTRTLKALTSRNFMLLTGSKPPAILDARSWLEAAGSHWVCTGYRFGEPYVRDLGGSAIFAAELEIEASMGREAWSGRLFVTDIWQKARVRRNWRMLQRVISRPEEGAQVPTAIRAMQLWR
jgi:hypothetical protein